MNITHLIVLTIGPVQSYISQARRTQDLFQGSRILSYLAGRGVQEAKEHVSPERIIYPSVPENVSDAYGSIPNRIVIAWDGDEADAAACARRIRETIENAWLTVSANTRDYFLAGVDGREVADDIWQQQEQSWLECYWVVVAYDGQQTYADNINAANAAMGARKLLRDFGPIQEVGRKDSITGEHAVLHDGRDDRAFWEARKADQRNRALLSSSERLGAISTVKRFAHEPKAGNRALQISDRYPSTSSVAVIPFKYDVLEVLYSDLDSDDLENALKKFIRTLLACFDTPGELFFTEKNRYNPEYFPPVDAIPGLELKRGQQARDEALDLNELTTQFMCIDGDYLYDDTLITKTIMEYRHSESHPDNLSGLVRDAQQALAHLARTASEHDIAPPQPYFAILSMDGDHMGKTLGTLESSDRHSAFSQHLAAFAQETVEHIVEETHPGRLVYAGGDDVLALLPVRHALTVAEQLRTAFTDRLTDTGFRTLKGDPITASTGIAFVHHTHDLQNAVTAANNAQKYIAKDAYGRRAIGVRLLRRSGEPREMGSKWVVTYNEKPEAIIPAMQMLQAAFFHNLLGRSLPYDIARIAYQMDGPAVPQGAKYAELERVTKRRFASPETASYTVLPADAKKLLGTTYKECKENVIQVLIWLTEVTPDMTQVQRWVELARFIAQKESDR